MFIKNVLKNNMCSGCGLCSEQEKDMQIDALGFLRPVKPIEDDISLNCCPGIKVEQTQDSDYDSIWGAILASYTGYSLNSDVRKMGSSGGVLTALLTSLLETNVVDAIIQVGASDINPLRNQVVITQDSCELIKNAGSRYAPSSPLSVVRSLMGNGKKYAIVAKPCDIAALRALTERDTSVKEQFPVLLSFMCAGIPSEKATYDILNKFKVDMKEVKSFRYRGDGWPGLTTAVDLQGKAYSMPYNESWGSILNRKLQVRCKICVDGTGELADIVCADAWHESKDGYPSFEEKQGRSLILVRTAQGKNVLEKAVSEGFVGLEGEYPVSNLPKIQPYQMNRKKTLLARIFALKLFGVTTPKYKGFYLFRLMFKTNPAVSLKIFLGTFVRKMKGRL